MQADPRGFIAKVSDFGLSKLVADSVGAVAATQSSSEASGTVTHMAPEVLTQGKVSPAADVYAFGILSEHARCLALLLASPGCWVVEAHVTPCCCVWTSDCSCTVCICAHRATSAMQAETAARRPKTVSATSLL